MENNSIGILEIAQEKLLVFLKVQGQLLWRATLELSQL